MVGGPGKSHVGLVLCDCCFYWPLSKRNTGRHAALRALPGRPGAAVINPLMGTSNYSDYSATSDSMLLGHWPLRGGLLHLVPYSVEGTGRGRSPPRPLLAVPNVTAHPSTASVPITVLMSYGPLLCGFNVPIKGVFIVTQLNSTSS